MIKFGILDIKAKINNNINCNIEMQVANRKDIEKRIMFYWGKIYTGSISSGEKYSKLEKTVSIIFVDFEIENLKCIPKYVSKWGVREEDFPSKTILTDVMEIYIIELPKVKKYQNKSSEDLKSWVKFINNPEVIGMGETREAIKKAKEILEEISQDEHERELAEYREKYIRDQMASEDYGFDQGLKQGLEQGLKQGRAERDKEMIKAMQDSGIEIDVICKIANLSKEEVEKILKLKS